MPKKTQPKGTNNLKGSKLVPQCVPTFLAEYGIMVRVQGKVQWVQFRAQCAGKERLNRLMLWSSIIAGLCQVCGTGGGKYNFKKYEAESEAGFAAHRDIKPPIKMKLSTWMTVQIMRHALAMAATPEASSRQRDAARTFVEALSKLIKRSAKWKPRNVPADTPQVNLRDAFRITALYALELAWRGRLEEAMANRSDKQLLDIILPKRQQEPDAAGSATARQPCQAALPDSEPDMETTLVSMPCSSAATGSMVAPSQPEHSPFTQPVEDITIDNFCTFAPLAKDPLVQLSEERVRRQELAEDNERLRKENMWLQKGEGVWRDENERLRQLLVAADIAH